MNKKQKIVFTNYKTCIFIAQTVKQHTKYIYPKKMILMSEKKAKLKAKCAKCLTDRTFIDKINDKYD